jgi:hypothetical protein
MATVLNKTRAILVASIAAGCFATANCTKGGSISSSGTASSGGGGITITLVYPSTSGAGWTPITLAGRYYIKGTRLTVTGNCDRGVDSIRVDEGAGDYAEEATCEANGTFTWTKTNYAGQSDKTLTFEGFDVNDVAIAGATATINVRMDNVAPAAVVVTDPATNPYQHTGMTASYDIDGTCDADTYRIATDGGVDITPAGVNWTYTVALTQGSSLNFEFYARDLAGNIAGVFTQTIEFAPEIVPLFATANVTAGGMVNGTGGFKLEASMAWHPDQQDSTTPAGAAAFNLETGLNNTANKHRSIVPYP